MKIARIAILSALVLSFAACGKYDRILKSTDYNLKYTKAMEYYQKGEYSRASTLFDQIANVFKGTVKADTVCFYQAQSYYGQKDYIMAGYYFKDFSKDYPRSPYAEEADYLASYCNYLLSPRPSLDQDYTNQALAGFQYFIVKFPSSKFIPDAQRLIIELRNKLVEKSYMNAKLYFDLGYYKASLIALHNSLNQFPDTKYREVIRFLIFKSNYLLADNSVPEKRKERFQTALDEYYAFIGEFPQSRYASEAEKMHLSTQNTLDSYK
jgi:outer membrane protein assembly factor BamD